MMERNANDERAEGRTIWHPSDRSRRASIGRARRAPRRSGTRERKALSRPPALVVLIGDRERVLVGLPFLFVIEAIL